ncbi:hypothetical protein HELRODRAFT_170110 [Helobdella robusta]|uniref:Uncharacterized protein n=1 Tax=Helobdella robusta TaxID=6412 RepID=T1F2M9_HELRO|nr:hypothetical protein HELRODRAFT_170110 [Helobdella robusta]ESO07564.1 hypothetical protein HELRODRAFT_170110 [Helobdella robusta]
MLSFALLTNDNRHNSLRNTKSSSLSIILPDNSFNVVISYVIVVLTINFIHVIVFVISISVSLIFYLKLYMNGVDMLHYLKKGGLISYHGDYADEQHDDDDHDHDHDTGGGGDNVDDGDDDNDNIRATRIETNKENSNSNYVPKIKNNFSNNKSRASGKNILKRFVQQDFVAYDGDSRGGNLRIVTGAVEADRWMGGEGRSSFAFLTPQSHFITRHTFHQKYSIFFQVAITFDGLLTEHYFYRHIGPEFFMENVERWQKLHLTTANYLIACFVCFVVYTDGAAATMIMCR